MLLNNSTSIDHTVLQSLTALFSFLLEMKYGATLTKVYESDR